MYRVAKKTTKRTQGHCLKCKHCKELYEFSGGGGTIVECTAENRCMITSFNSRDYYCVEYKGANDMTESEMEEIARKNRNNYSLEAYKEYVKKYYPKKEHKQMIKDYKEKLK